MLNQNNNRPLSFSLFFFAIIEHICTLFSNNLLLLHTTYTCIQWLFMPFILSSLSNNLFCFRHETFHLAKTFLPSQFAVFLTNANSFNAKIIDRMTELLSDFILIFFRIFLLSLQILREHIRVKSIFTNYSAIICIDLKNDERKKKHQR